MPYLPGLNVSAPTTTPEARNFRPPTWPPCDDFPISIDAEGRVISQYGDHRWDLSPWAGTALSVSFNDSPKLYKNQLRIDPHNAGLMRLICAWWLYGPNGIQSPKPLVARLANLKPLFALCTQRGISAADLTRYPRVVDEYVASPREGQAACGSLSILHQLWLDRELLGFTLIDEQGLARLAAVATKRDSAQTAYIPPRIWTYQVLRLRECMDDFLAHQSKVEACFQFCVDAYIRNAESAEQAFTNLPTRLKPFIAANENKQDPGCRFYGSFRNTAERFGIARLLDRWIGFEGSIGIRILSSYLTLISWAGLAYVLNFSLMRLLEGLSLRADCLTVDRDELGTDIYLIGGTTTKTQNDDDAKWIVSPTVKVAIDAMKSVARLRVSAASLNPHVSLCEEDSSNPLLQARSYEPWAGARDAQGAGIKSGYAYIRVLNTFRRLLDSDEIRITADDLKIARRMNLDLDPDTYALGKVWPLAWHQLRRTGAVNMLSAGLVTESDLCYQLKHLSRHMTRYYANNHRHLKAVLNERAAGTYIAEMYESLARKSADLLTIRHVSPHGEKRKAQILEPIADKSHAELVKLGKAGKVDYHETFLGGCSKPGVPCPLGGVSNIAGCMGYADQKPCEWATVDVEKRHVIAGLADVLRSQIEPKNAGSMLNKSLEAQLESAERALEVIDAT